MSVIDNSKFTPGLLNHIYNRLDVTPHVVLKRQLDTTKCHYTEEGLGGALDELTVLLQLGAHAHVAELVSNSDHLQ